MPKKIMIETLERLYNKTEVVEEQGFPGFPPTQSKPAKEIAERKISPEDWEKEINTHPDFEEDDGEVKGRYPFSKPDEEGDEEETEQYIPGVPLKGKEVEEQVPGGPAIPLPTKPKPPKPVGLTMGEREDPSSEADKARAKKEYGNVKFGDEKNKKYPIDAKHIHAAISYFAMPKNYSKYSREERRVIARNIVASAEKLGVQVSDKWKKKHGI